MAYDRDNAVNYAAKHWNIPCDDGVFWLTDEAISIEVMRRELKALAAEGWDPMFVQGDGRDPEKAVFRRTVGGSIQEKKIHDWAGLADCAHFLSRCLSAGGAKIAERGVRELVATLQARSDTKTLCERVSRERAQRVIDTGIFQKGDMLGYFNVSPTGDFGGRREYSHSTMYVGKIDAAGIGGVTCHTVARFPPKSWVNDSWWLHDGYTYTLIHFTAGDIPPSHRTVASLEGWWKLVYPWGREEFYYVHKDGTARYSQRRPNAVKDQLRAAEGSAYWFLDAAGKITFIWRATGTVEVWTPGPGTGGFSSLINSNLPAAITRLF